MENEANGAYLTILFIVSILMMIAASTGMSNLHDKEMQMKIHAAEGLLLILWVASICATYASYKGII